MSGLKATFVGSWEASCGSAWSTALHVSTLAVLPRPPASLLCGCRPGWPLASSKSSLGAYNGGLFLDLMV
jgi:hypothetical protein